MSLDLAHEPAERSASALVQTLVAQRTGARLLAAGVGVGEGAVTAPARWIGRMEDLAELKPGEIVMAEATRAEWEPALARAGGLLVNRGDEACHAAEFARACGVPAIVGVIDGASPLWSGAVLTLIARPDQSGRAYQELNRAEPPGARAVAAYL